MDERTMDESIEQFAMGKLQWLQLITIHDPYPHGHKRSTIFKPNDIIIQSKYLRCYHCCPNVDEAISVKDLKLS